MKIELYGWMNRTWIGTRYIIRFLVGQHKGHCRISFLDFLRLLFKISGVKVALLYSPYLYCDIRLLFYYAISYTYSKLMALEVITFYKDILWHHYNVLSFLVVLLLRRQQRALPKEPCRHASLTGHGWIQSMETIVCALNYCGWRNMYLQDCVCTSEKISENSRYVIVEEKVAIFFLWQLHICTPSDYYKIDFNSRGRPYIKIFIV